VRRPHVSHTWLSHVALTYICKVHAGCVAVCVLQCACCSVCCSVRVAECVAVCVAVCCRVSHMHAQYPRDWERTLLDAFENPPCSHCNTHCNTLQHTLQQGATQGIGALFQPAQTICAIQSSLHTAARNAQVDTLCVAVCVAVCVANFIVCCSTHCSTLAIHNATNLLSTLPPEMLR